MQVQCILNILLQEYMRLEEERWNPQRLLLNLRPPLWLDDLITNLTKNVINGNRRPLRLLMCAGALGGDALWITDLLYHKIWHTPPSDFCDYSVGDHLFYKHGLPYSSLWVFPNIFPWMMIPMAYYAGVFLRTSVEKCCCRLALMVHFRSINDHCLIF